MVRKHCAYGLCKSDSRYPEEGVEFFKFPKPYEWGGEIDESSNIYKQCQLWIKSCGRPREDLNISKIIEDYKKYKYSYWICSKVI